MNHSDEAIAVYVVEDDSSVLRSFCALLAAHGHDTIACRSAEEFLEVYDPKVKACLVLDLRLPGLSGIQLQARLAAMGVNLPIIIVTAHGDVPLAVQAMRAGAIDFIEKPAVPEQVLEAVGIAGNLIFNRTLPEVPRSIVADRLKKLTDREQEVLGHLLEGKLNKEISAELGISQRTVEVHRARIREKMQARSIAELVRLLG